MKKKISIAAVIDMIIVIILLYVRKLWVQSHTVEEVLVTAVPDILNKSIIFFGIIFILLVTIIWFMSKYDDRTEKRQKKDHNP